MPGPEGSTYAPTKLPILPGAGAKFLPASSKLMRHSIEWPLQLDVFLRDRERLSCGYADALLDDVNPGDFFGDAVLDLHAGVHLEEVVLAVLQHALDRSGAAVVDGLRGVDADFADLRTHLGVDRRGRGLFDQLLVAALHGAVALTEVDHVALVVGEDLDLDVARVGQVTLEVDGVVVEELLPFTRGALEGFFEFICGQRDAEALAAAAAGCLDCHRVADVVHR